MITKTVNMRYNDGDLTPVYMVTTEKGTWYCPRNGRTVNLTMVGDKAYEGMPVCDLHDVHVFMTNDKITSVEQLQKEVISQERYMDDEY